jgi:hypothetical protein
VPHTLLPVSMAASILSRPPATAKYRCTHAHKYHHIDICNNALSYMLFSKHWLKANALMKRVLRYCVVSKNSLSPPALQGVGQPPQRQQL